MSPEPATAPPPVESSPEPTPIPDYILEAVAASETIASAGGQGGGPSGKKFNPKVTLKLLLAIRDGNYYEPACRLAGVSYDTFRQWMHRADDDDPDGPWAAFSRAVKVAEAEAEAESLRYVRAASRDPRFWAAGMTFLERRHPDRWKRQDGPGVNVQIGIAVGVQTSDEQRRGLLPIVDVRALSPGPEPLTALSPGPEIPVSADGSEAKATPIEGVSPSKVV